MADLPKSGEPGAEEWLRDLGKIRSEVLLPGFWTTLIENCESWAKLISVGPFWSKANETLDQWRTEYHSDTGAALLAGPGLPGFVSKSEQGVRDKLSRHHWRNKEGLGQLIDREGPPVPKLGDLVRTRVSCQYIDGVEFLTGKLLSLAKEMDLSPQRTREGRIEGYFAQHLNFSHAVVFKLGGHEELVHVVCEVQVASEMATRMWAAAHPFYEYTRSHSGDPEEWQWHPDDARFISNQLGHMIHLADGLLIQLRKSATKGKA